MNIDILINNLDYNLNLYLDVNNKKIIVNNKEFYISSEKIDELIKIIQYWEPNYINNNVIDSESFEIKISNTEKEEIIRGRGKYPDNYNLLKEWISELL